MTCNGVSIGSTMWTVGSPSNAMASGERIDSVQDATIAVYLSGTLPVIVLPSKFEF